MHPPSTELALKRFDADAAFSAALAEFQEGPPEGTIIAEARRAADHGISWFARPSEPGVVEVRLRHAGGAEISAEGESITALLAGLLGHPLAQDIGVIAAAQAAEPEQEEAGLEEALAVATQGSPYKAALITSPARAAASAQAAAVDEVNARSKAFIEAHGLIETKGAGAALAAAKAAAAAEPEQLQPVTGAMVAASLAAAVGESLAAAVAALPPSPAQAAAESLAAATGGAVVEEEPDEAERLRLAVPLTDEQKAVCVDMIKALTPDQRKAFTIAFRHAFRVPREEKAIAPLIAEVRHMEFCDRWSVENAGGVAP
jgi:hypothetical protein